MTRRHAIDESMLDDAIRRVRKGKIASFEIIMRRFERPLRAWLAVLSPPGVDVDEVAQQAFVAAYSRLDEYELGTSFSAWFFTIARYQLMTEATRLDSMVEASPKVTVLRAFSVLRCCHFP